MSGFWQDLFDAYPAVPASNVKIMIALAIPIILLLLFLVAPVVRRKTASKSLKKIIARSRTGLIGFAIGLFLLVWLRLEAVPVLAMRLWFYLAVLALIGWLVWKVILYRTIKSRIERAEARRQRK